MINGLAGTSQDWDPTFLEGLATANQLLLPDNRGIGASADNRAPFTIEDLAADCAELMTAELDRPAAILGWSMGGFIALALALGHPDQVSKLILLSTDPGGPTAELGDPGILAQLVDLSPPPREQARTLLSLLFDDQTARDLFAQVGDVIAAARASLNQDLLDRQLGALEAWHSGGVADRLPGIDVPALIATGTTDRVIPPANSLGMARAIRDSWLLRFPGGGHAFMAQHPALLARIVNEFLSL